MLLWFNYEDKETTRRDSRGSEGLGFFMKNIIHSVFVFLTLFVAEIQGQQINNLVPNGDFEEIDSCFKQMTGLWKVNNWTAAVSNEFCSSDYFNKCQLNNLWLPRSPIYNTMGNGSAAIVLKSTIPMHREYLQIELSSTLKVDSRYVVSAAIRPVYLAYQSEWGVDRFELLLTNYPIVASLYNNSIPSYIDTCSSVMTNQNYLDTNLWYICKSFYTAKGGEKYLTLGIFSPDSIYDFYPIGGINTNQWQIAYYLIDDVMVYNASDTIKQLPEPILPNVFSPNQDGVNEVYTIENLPENSTLEVFNRWGGLVFSQAPYQNNWPGNAPNGQPVADGVYFAILTYQDQNGRVQQKKQTVHVLR
jgi:gliding motility-associated-like protein